MTSAEYGETPRRTYFLGYAPSTSGSDVSSFMLSMRLSKITMRIAVVPASTKTGAATIKSLLNKPVQTKGFYRDLSKVPASFSAQANFTAVEGDVLTGGSIALIGSDTVLAIIPPVFDGRDLVEHAEKTSLNFKSAIERAGGIKRLVLLSSGGAEFSEGVVRTFGAIPFLYSC